jgi:pyruvate/2-oxoglutarate dehydrogenase complex dihydrolipoamide acyltransferase (E2) component
LETDKVNVEVPAEENGVLGAIARKVGDTVGVGEVLGTLSAAAATVPRRSGSARAGRANVRRTFRATQRARAGRDPCCSKDRPGKQH